MNYLPGFPALFLAGVELGTSHRSTGRDYTLSAVQYKSVSMDLGRGLVAQRIDKLLDLMALAVLLLLRFLRQLAV